MRRMFESDRRFGALASGIALALMVVGCGGAPDSTQESGGEAEQTEVASVEAPNGEVESADPSGAPAEPMTPAPAPDVRSVPAGTLLTFEVREDVSTASHERGDEFSLVLADEVTGVGGAVLPIGTLARGLVAEAHPSESADEDALLVVRVGSVEVNGSTHTLEGEVEGAAIRGAARDSGSRTAAKIATGAAAGAMIGQILGRDTRSTVQGAAVGTAAGVGVALSTRDGHAELPSGSMITVRLDRDLEI